MDKNIPLLLKVFSVSVYHLVTRTAAVFIIVAACQLCWPLAIIFYRCSLDLFLTPNLRGRLAYRHQTATCLMVTRIL